MVSAIGAMNARMMGQIRTNGAKSGAPVAASAQAGEAAKATASTPAATLAAEGAPIDTDKVASIKAALEAGTYAIDPRAIADKMIALDLPGVDR